MSDNGVPVSDQSEETLKYLSFVQEAAKLAVPYASKAYDYAKDNSGSLKPGVEAIETTVKTVVGPAYETFQDVPNEVLKIVDRKVDESVNKAMSTNIAKEFKNHGVVETTSELAKSAYKTLEPTAKELLVRYEPVVEQHAASAWHSLNKFPLFRTVAKMVVPAAAFLSEKYNETVEKTAKEGYQVSSYLPLVPTEKMARVFKDPEVEPEAVVPSGDEGTEKMARVFKDPEVEPEAVVSSGDEGAVVAQ